MKFKVTKFRNRELSRIFLKNKLRSMKLAIDKKETYSTQLSSRFYSIAASYNSRLVLSTYRSNSLFSKFYSGGFTNVSIIHSLLPPIWNRVISQKMNCKPFLFETTNNFSIFIFAILTIFMSKSCKFMKLAYIDKSC